MSDIDYLIQKGGWYKFLTTDVTKMYQEYCVELKHLLSRRIRSTVFEDGGDRLGQKLMEYGDTIRIPNRSQRVCVIVLGSAFGGN